MKTVYQHNRELIENAVPRILSEDEQSWTKALALDDQLSAKDRLLWGSNVPGSGAPEQVIVGGILAMQTMGYDVSEAEKLVEPALKARQEDDRITLGMLTAKVFHILNNCPKVKDHPYFAYTVYENYDQYRKAVSFPAKADIDTASKDFLDRTHAAWLTQIIGAALGTCLEGYTADALKAFFGEIRDYPRKPSTYNDDITFELAFLEAFIKSGSKITSEDVALHWAGMIPSAWSAEDIALQNFKLGIFPPESGYRCNPWREWIGAQMRGAICGMLAPGNAEEAARLAWIDGCISHHNNGILGEIFNAVMVSLAYSMDNVKDVMLAAFSAIPADSEYRSVIDFALESCRQHDDWLSAWRPCEEKYSAYNWIHAYPNAAAEVVALYYCDNDFDTCMNIIGMLGQDSDCNAAQIATLFGAMQGHSCIDAHWSDPIGDDLYTYVRGYHQLTITELAQRTVDAVNNADKH